MADNTEEGEITEQNNNSLPLPPFTILHNDLSKELFQKSLEMAVEVLRVPKLSQKDAAEELKKKLEEDADFNLIPGRGPWHVIIGRQFTISLSAELGHVAYFHIPSLNDSTVLLFRNIAVALP